MSDLDQALENYRRLRSGQLFVIGVAAGYVLNEVLRGLL